MKRMYKIIATILFCMTLNIGVVFGTNVPTNYDLRDYIDIEVKNQSPFGICYSYGMMESIETNLALTKNEYVDLSEIHFAIMSGQGAGGYYVNDNDEYFKNNIGPVYEEDCSHINFLYNYYNGDELDKYIGDWLIDDNIDNSIDEEKLREYQERLTENNAGYKITKTIKFPKIYKEEYKTSSEEEIQQTRNAVKEHIMKYGSVWAYISISQYLHNNDYTVMNCKEDIQDAHTISIIGWDDNFSKDNFPDEIKPQKDGAYLALNSWGEDWGNNGCFWISYEDRWVESNLWGVESIEEISDNIKTNSFTVKDIENGNSIKNAYIKYGQKVEIDIDLSIAEIIENADINVQIRNSVVNYTDNVTISKSEINNNKANVTINIDTTELNTGTYIIDILYGDNKLSKSIKIIENTFRYIINDDNTITIIGYTGKEKNIEIPREFMGYEVSGIGDNAFYSNQLLEIIIHDNIKYIGDDIVKDGVIIRGEKGSIVEEYANQKNYIFLEPEKNYIETDNWEYDFLNEKLIIKNINAFGEDKSKWGNWKAHIKEVEILDEVNEIPDEAFVEMEKIKKINISNNVTKIGKRAFDGCVELQEIPLSDNIEYIGDYAFSNCIKLKNIHLSNKLTIINEGLFWGSYKINEIIIPDGVTKISKNAFMYCDDLEKVVIPDSVTEIGESAFYLCSNLQIVIIPEKVNNIYALTFSQCNNIKVIIYKGENLNLEENAVDDFVNIFLIKKDARVTSNYNSINFIDNFLDIKYKELDYITVNKTIDNLNTKYIIDEQEINITDNKVFIGDIKDDKEITINVYIEGINTPIQTLHSTVKDLKMNTFEYVVNEDGKSITLTMYYGPCKYELQEEYFGYKLTHIGEYAFSYNDELLEIKLPNTIVSIKEGAFFKNTNLKEIYIPESVTSISNNAFKGCDSLERIDVSEKNLFYSSDEAGILYNKDKSVLLKYPNGKNTEKFTLNSEVKEIASWAIENTNIKEIICTQNLKKIDEYAIIENKNLEQLFIYKETDTIGEMGIIVDNDNFVLYCEPDSVAQQYGKNYNYIIKTEWNEEKIEENPEKETNEEPKEEKQENLDGNTIEKLEEEHKKEQNKNINVQLEQILEQTEYINSDVENSANKNETDKQNNLDANTKKEEDKQDNDNNLNNKERNTVKFVIIIMISIIGVALLVKIKYMFTKKD